MTHGTEHLSTETLERYRAQSLSPQERTMARVHALACSACHELLRRATDTHAALSSLRASFAPAFDEEPEHLTYERMTAYVDGQSDEVEREIIESHLAICDDCEADARDLYRYQAIAGEASLEPPFQQDKAAPLPSASLWQRLSSFNWFPSFGTALAPAATLATILVIFLLGLWAIYQRRQPEPQTQARIDRAADGNVGIPITAASPTPSPLLPTQTTGQALSNQVAPSGVAAADSASASNNVAERSRRPADEKQASLSIALNDGENRVVFDAAGNLRGLEALPSDVQQAVKTTLSSGAIRTPRALDTLTGNAGVLMGESVADGETRGVPFALMSPVGKVVRAEQPTFSWHPLKGAEGYTVAIVDEKFDVVEQSGRLTTTAWTPSKPLPRGATYSWQVTAWRDGAEVVSPVAPAPQARFKVLEQRLADELSHVEASNVQSHLARGVIYARAGLMDEARKEFEDLAEANPRSPVTRKLLKSLSRR